MQAELFREGDLDSFLARWEERMQAFYRPLLEELQNIQQARINEGRTIERDGYLPKDPDSPSINKPGTGAATRKEGDLDVFWAKFEIMQALFKFFLKELHKLGTEAPIQQEGDLEAFLLKWEGRIQALRQPLTERGITPEAHKNEDWMVEEDETLAKAPISFPINKQEPEAITRELEILLPQRGEAPQAMEKDDRITGKDRYLRTEECEDDLQKPVEKGEAISRRVFSSNKESEAINRRMELAALEMQITRRIEKVERKARWFAIVASIFLPLLFFAILPLDFIAFRQTLLLKEAKVMEKPVGPPTISMTGPNEKRTPEPGSANLGTAPSPQEKPVGPPPVSMTGPTEKRAQEPNSPNLSAAPSPQETETRFVASTTGKYYHYPDCKWAKTIPQSKLIVFKSIAEAQKAGYKPCPVCNPPDKD